MIEICLKLLKKAGCRCRTPLVGFRPGKGPRCRLCNVEAKWEMPSQEIESIEWLKK